MPARRVCAWCRKVMTEGTEPTTHGICAACEAKIRREELGGDSQGEGGENAEARREANVRFHNLRMGRGPHGEGFGYDK